jgi:hypothetical protein
MVRRGHTPNFASVRFWQIVFSNSGSGCQTLRDRPCRAHCSLRWVISGHCISRASCPLYPQKPRSKIEASQCADFRESAMPIGNRGGSYTRLRSIRRSWRDGMRSTLLFAIWLLRSCTRPLAIIFSAKPEELARWVQLRAVSFCSMRSTGLADDDEPVSIFVSRTSAPAKELPRRRRRAARA